MAKKEEKAAQSKFMAPMKISEELTAIVGRGPMPRTEVTKKLWDYIKANKCQDAKNKRNINPDEKLAKVFGGKKAVNVFEMTKLVSKHLS
jgi:chromatin remodeling complex protein RSC6